jgi:hypothetical protein
MTKRKSKKRQQQKRRAQRAMKRRQRSKERTPSRTSFGATPLDLPTSATLAAAMIELEKLGDEPEFDNLDLGEEAVEIVVNMISDSDDEITRLGKKGDQSAVDRLIDDAKLEALQQIVTPALKSDIRRRLARASRRLRREGEKQRADKLDALGPMLDWPGFPWIMFRPLAEAFQNVVEGVLSQVLLHNTIAEAAGVSPQDLSQEQLLELTHDPNVIRHLQERLETDQDMQALLESQTDALFERLQNRLFEGTLNLGLFTTEELALWLALRDYRLTEAGIDFEQAPFPQEGVQTFADAMNETISLLNTPARRARRREHLARMAREDWEKDQDMALLISLVQDGLDDPDNPEKMGIWLYHALYGEQEQFLKRTETDETLDEQVETLYDQMWQRLEQGETPISD